MKTSFLIYATWGEYDDFTIRPLFICHDKDEAFLFLTALNNKEPEYIQKVKDYFNQNYSENYYPQDIGFGIDELEVVNI